MQKKSASPASYIYYAHEYDMKNVVRGLLMLIGIIFIGTTGYMLIEKWDFLESLYMTIITITTVGFKEVRPISDHGRIFTIFLIFSGVGIIAYTLGLVAQAMIEFQIMSILGRRKLGLKIRSLKDHYIICGYGKLGKVVANELKSKDIPLLVIEKEPELREALERNEHPYIIADATMEEVLIEAGIERAKGIVTLLSSDADNLFITMTARTLNPELFVLSRADEEHTYNKLLRVGANRVVMPHIIGGQKLANLIIKPAVAEFLELTVHNREIELEMEEVMVEKGSPLNGLSLEKSGIRQQTNVIIVAIRKKEGQMIFNPSSITKIEEGDVLIALGQRDGLRKLENLLNPSWK